MMSSTNVTMSLFLQNVWGGRFTPAPPPPTSLATLLLSEHFHSGMALQCCRNGKTCSEKLQSSKINMSVCTWTQYKSLEHDFPEEGCYNQDGESPNENSKDSGQGHLQVLVQQF